MAMKIVWAIIFQRRQPAQFAADSTGNYLGRIFVSRVMLSDLAFFRHATLTGFGVVNESKTSSHVANVSISSSPARRSLVRVSFNSLRDFSEQRELKSSPNSGSARYIDMKNRVRR